MKPFKSTSCTSGSDDFIQCKISSLSVSLLSLLLSVKSFCIIHEDRFGSTKNHKVGRWVIYCLPRPERRIILMPFLTACSGGDAVSLVNLFQCFTPLERLSSSQYLT